MDHFQYKPIDLQGSSFRLVRLFKAEYGPVQCELFDAWLDDEQRPEYEALSYTWGNTYKAHEIEVNGKTLPVTTNLLLALRNLRYFHQDRILWIDAICIDQNNDKERGHQVLQMALIYEKAEQVVIWLGSATKETDVIFDCMSEVEKEAVNHACRNWKVTDKRWLDIWQTVISPPGGEQAARGTSSQRCQGLYELFNRPWFDRVWIIQEVANARKAKVACGTKSVSARVFALSPTWVFTKPSPHCQAILGVMPGPTRNSSWWMQNHDLYTLLVRFKDSQASDPRDKIYALLGISSNVSTTDALRPDYERSEVEVIQHTMAFLLDLPGGASCFPDWTLPRFLQNLERLDTEVLLWAASHGILTTVEALLPGKIESNIRDHDGQTPLLLASENGHMDVVNLLLATDKVGINVQNSKSQTPLLLAIENGHRDVAGLLLETNEVDINIQNSERQTPLLIAAARGYDDIVQALLMKSQADINFQTLSGQTPLLLAVERGSAGVAKLLLRESMIDINLQDSARQTPLLQAITQRDQVMTEILLEEFDIDINLSNSVGHTPLLLAAQTGQTTTVHRLLDTGAADDAVEDLLGWTPLWLAAINGYDAIVQMLLDYHFARSDKPNPSHRTASEQRYELLAKSMLATCRGDESCTHNPPRQTPLFWALHHDYHEVVKLLLQSRHAPVREIIESDGEVFVWLAKHGFEEELAWLLETVQDHSITFGPEQWASKLMVSASDSGSDELISILIDSGMCDVSTENRVFGSAAFSGNTAIVRQFVDTGRVDVNCQSNITGRSPLWLAAFMGHTSTVELLLSTADVDVNRKDPQGGRTPLAAAAEFGELAMVKLLLKTEGVELDATDEDGRTPLELARHRHSTDSWRLHINPKLYSRQAEVIRLLETYSDRQHAV